MIEISKELLSEVLKYSVDKYKIVSIDEITQIRVWKKDTDMWDYRSYDIHHLAHKCKEWAFKQGFEIVVMAYSIRIYRNGYEVYNTNTTLFDLDMFFKACEWILDSKPL